MKQNYTFGRMLSAVLLLMMSTFAWAYELEVDGVYYNINEDRRSVEVTYRIYSDGYYSGDLVIPSSITYNNNTYSVTKIGRQAFSYCERLTSISLPKSITSIGFSAFYRCFALKNVTIPEGVTNIGESAFEWCDSISVISLPKSLTKIEKGAFGWFFSINTVICNAENVPELGSGVFVSPSYSTLYVPASALEAYKAADQWKDFGTILPLEEIPAGIGSIEADKGNAPYYTLDGIQVQAPAQKGIYIQNGKKVIIK